NIPERCSDTLHQSCQVEVVTFRINHGEPRADATTRARWIDGRRPRRGECGFRRKGPAAGASVESSILRRSRYANRQRWNMVLPGNTNRAAGTGAVVLDHPQTRGWQVLSGDAGRKGR